MLHCDDETLALVALGDSLADDERRHLRDCVRCQTALDQNKALVSTGRQIGPDDWPSEPGPQVWDSIAAELGLGADVAPFVPDDADVVERAKVIALADRRRGARRSRRHTALAAVAASVAGIAVGALGVAAVSTDPAATVVAESQLTVVPIDAGGSELSGADVSGEARIVDTDGQDFAEVDASGMPAVDGYYEVWLIKSDLSGMISLGALTAGSQGKFTIPAGTDLTEYTIVDISVESLDGDPLHSRESLLRGSIDA